MHKFIAPIALVFSLAYGSAYGAQAAPLPIAQCQDEAPYGLPYDRKSDTTLICRTGYVLEHDNKAKIPVWVSYTLKPEEATGCLGRDTAFSSDKSLPVGKRSEEKDYAKSGYDTGHMANDGDFRWDEQVSRESFILSNMAPQLPGFNRGIWKKLEDSTRGWAISRRHELLIYVGPIYNREKSSTIGADRVAVPNAFFKIIIDTVTGETMAFIMKHEPSQESLSTFITSVPEVQRQTGVQFPMPKRTVVSGTTWPLTIKNATRAKKGVCAVR